MLRRFAFIGSTAFVFTSALIASFGAASGCRHDREPPVAVVDAPQIDVVLDSKVEIPPVTVLVDGMDQAADLKCLGMTRITPPVMSAPDSGVDETGGDDSGASDAAVAPGTLVEKEIELIGFGTGGADKLDNQTVDVFYKNNSRATPDQTVTTDGKGLTKVLLPEGVRVGYKVRASPLLDNYFGLDDLHQKVQFAGLPKPIIRWQGVTLERRDFFALALTGDRKWRPKPGNANIAGRVMDCNRRYMQWADIEVRDYTDDPSGKTRLQFGKCGETACRVFLTDSELPDAGRQYTSRSSLFLLLDMPANRKLRIVAVGTKSDGTRYDVAWRDADGTADTITTQFLEPNNPKGF